METKTIIYLVAAALIFRVVLRLIFRYMKKEDENLKSDD